MDFKDPSKRKTSNPETIISNKIKDHLRYKGWFVQKIHGNKFQSGLPDFFCSHPRYPNRWVEVKTPARARQRHGGVSPRQFEKFNEMSKAGVGIWILTTHVKCDITLIKPPNWKGYVLGGSRVQRPKGL